ncbi:sulfatase/phosphatase domain-containing protein [Maribellus mangrovi]|uniref:sulfatase/phosphatase domain-containing protein n=1 Tax=Maribellus mangrovi TaxID=3133146 RepID=UPI0030ED598E
MLNGETPEDFRTAHCYHDYEYPLELNVMRHFDITSDCYTLIHFYYEIDQWELYDLEKGSTRNAK